MSESQCFSILVTYDSVQIQHFVKVCESTSMLKLQLAECTFTPFFGIVVPCAWEAPAWVKKLLQMSVTFRNIPYLYNIKSVRAC